MSGFKVGDKVKLVRAYRKDHIVGFKEGDVFLLDSIKGPDLNYHSSFCFSDEQLQRANEVTKEEIRKIYHYVLGQEYLSKLRNDKTQLEDDREILEIVKRLKDNY